MLLWLYNLGSAPAGSGVSNPATAGYRIADSAPPNVGHVSWGCSAWINGTWVTVAETTLTPANEHLLYEWDGGFPSSPGDEGNWTRAEKASSTLLESLDTRAGADGQTLYVDPTDGDILWALMGHSSAEQFEQYSLNTGTGYWTQNVSNESVASWGGGNEFAMAVDSTGTPWIVSLNGGTSQAESRYRDTADDTWKDGGLASAGSLGTDSGTEFRPSRMERLVIGGSPGIGCAFPWEDGTFSGLVFAYRLDSDGATDDWTVETITTDFKMDDHASLCAGVLPGDTDSTVCATCKRFSGGSEYNVYRRTTGGTWESGVNAFAGATRVKLVMDETNGEVYGFYYGSNKVLYKTADATTTLSFGSAQDAIDPAGTGTSTNIGIPSHPVNSDTGLLVTWGSDSDAWWNVLTIAPPPIVVSPYYYARHLAAAH